MRRTTAPQPLSSRNARKIERKPVAHVDAGVQLVARVQRKRLADSRLEIEMPPKNAAAERAGYEIRSPGRAPLRRNGRAPSPPRAT